MSALALPPMEERYVKPYGAKAQRFIKTPPERQERINILHGSVRAQKTWTLHPKTLQLCRYKVAGLGIIFGVSKNTIYNNVLNDLFTIVGTKNYSYNRSNGDLDLFGSKWIVVGAKDEGSEKYVRGLTIGRAIGDELTLIPTSFLNMLITRMSPEGARLYGSTNPDTPFHDVKALIDKGKAAGVYAEHFTLGDNLSLTQEYKDHLNAQFPPGTLYHKRFVLGLWVTGEGAIYKDCWSDELYFTHATAPEHLYEPVGRIDESVAVDCGVDHVQVYGEFLDDGMTLWMTHEYWWDSHETLRQKTDREYREDLVEFMKLNGRPNARVILPPECASFDAELTQAGIWHTDADNDVADGIKAVASMMALKRLRFRVEEVCRGQRSCICGTRCCVRSVESLHAHAWDPKARARGEEKPLKQKDDGADMVRYKCKTDIQPWRLAQA